MKARTHELKIWPAQFEAVASGRKTFELRKNDRDFKTGDVLLLREFEPKSEEFTGCCMWVHVSHVMYGGRFGLPEGMCIMSIGSTPIVHKTKEKEI